MLVNRTSIREFSGKIIGYVDLDTTCDKIVRDFYGKILGRYDKKQNVTRDFYGKIIAYGDQAAMLLGLNERK